VSRAVPVICALLVWWFATGLILYLVRRPAATFRWSLLASAVVAVVSLAGLVAVRDVTTPFGAYAAFGCAVGLWGFLELGFLTGLITGPRRHRCAPGCSGWPHFRHAIEAILHHEIAILVAAGVVFAIGYGAANPVGTWTFAVLWVMRQSAKLNLFLGVRNPGHELLPPHLAYLEGYFTRRPINALFPFSVTLPMAVAGIAAYAAFAPGATAFAITGHLLVATLLALAVLEHWLMVLPLPLDRMWGWATGASGGRDKQGGNRADGDAPPTQRARATPAAT
jgi:putative photosynthetic complex assembly protein 2